MKTEIYCRAASGEADPPLPLVEAARKVLIVCHSEDISQLARSLGDMGFQVEVRRQVLPASQSRYCSAAKCLLSHLSAWRRVCEIGEPCIVVEADFVPVRSFAHLPSPPAHNTDGCCCWLYSSAQRIYRRVSNYFASGQSATTVANFWTPAAALQAINFALEEIDRFQGNYSPWDTYLRPALKARGVPLLLIPWRSYGEHGGFANSEHAKFGINATHRADVLYSPLCFLPMYARGSHAIYGSVRSFYRAKTALRLFSGRYVEWALFSDASLNRRELADVLWFGGTRLVAGF